MCRFNFRVKVDLSKIYNDVRRSSWIYLDKGSISCICHVQNHIAKVFDVQRPFHLLLNTGEYLPPNEDARILKEDETIVVVPGTGLRDDDNPVEDPVPTPPKPCISNPVVSRVKNNESSDEEDTLAEEMGTTADNTAFFSMLNDSRLESASTSKLEASAMEESLTSENPSPEKQKRKRTRRKKFKGVTPEAQPNGNGEPEAEYKKPKIINSVTVSNGKHIRFGDVEKLEVEGYESSVSTDSHTRRASNSRKNGTEESRWDKPASSSNLATLLALRQSSTPITFARKKSQEEAQPQTQTPVKHFQSIKQEGLTVDPKRHFLMENMARLNDVIAFKMLKMGVDYTPQVSGYITATPVEILADKSTYTFKILTGKDEIQAPQGKFELETEEETADDTETDLITLSWSQLIEPRLIYRE